MQQDGLPRLPLQGAPWDGNGIGPMCSLAELLALQRMTALGSAGTGSIGGMGAFTGVDNMGGMAGVGNLGAMQGALGMGAMAALGAGSDRAGGLFHGFPSQRSFALGTGDGFGKYGFPSPPGFTQPNVNRLCDDPCPPPLTLRERHYRLAFNQAAPGYTANLFPSALANRTTNTNADHKSKTSGKESTDVDNNPGTGKSSDNVIGTSINTGINAESSQALGASTPDVGPSAIAGARESSEPQPGPSSRTSEPNVRLLHCVNCEYVTTDMNILMDHVDTHFPVRTYLCIHCTQSFRGPQELQAHSQSRRCPYQSL